MPSVLTHAIGNAALGLVFAVQKLPYRKAGWSWGSVDRDGRTIWIADAHRGDGKRFVVHSDEKLSAFLELELAIRASGDKLSREVKWIDYDLTSSIRSAVTPSPLKLMGIYEDGPVAQRLEQGTHNPLVPGSNPGGPSSTNYDLR